MARKALGGLRDGWVSLSDYLPLLVERKRCFFFFVCDGVCSKCHMLCPQGLQPEGVCACVLPSVCVSV